MAACRRVQERKNKTYRCVGICLLKPLYLDLIEKYSYVGKDKYTFYCYIFIVETWKLISYMRQAIALDSSLQHKIRVAMAVNKTDMSLAHLTQFNISRAGCLTLPEKFWANNKATNVRISAFYVNIYHKTICALLVFTFTYNIRCDAIRIQDVSR